MIPAAVIALIVVGAIVGGAAVIGAPVFAVPVLALLLAGWLVVALGRRVLGRPPRPRTPVRFSAEDRATLVPPPSPAERAANRRGSAQDARR